MARIKINDLPMDVKISKKEMKGVRGGIGSWPTPDMPVFDYYRPICSTLFARPTSRYYIDTVPLPE